MTTDANAMSTDASSMTTDASAMSAEDVASADAAGYGLLRGRTAFVTGAARGIGLAVASRFAREGAAVVLADLDRAAAAASAGAVAARTGATAVAVGVDVADEQSVAAAADEAERLVGPCDVVVANAGILLLRNALQISAAEFLRTQQVNLLGAFVTARVFADRLVARGRPGAVVMSSSLFGLRGGAGNAAYAASKFGMIGVVESMAADLAPHGVRVNAVCPGQISSDMMDDLFRVRSEERGTDPQTEHDRFVQRIPMGRLGTPEDVADGYVFFASDLARYVTGQRLVIDGGWSVS